MSPVPVLVALADPVRCRIVEMLRAEAQPVHRIASAFPISRPAISRHLKVLKRARLISEKKVGRENIYVLHPRRLEPVRKWLDAIHPVSVAAAVAVPVEVAAAPVEERKPVARKAARTAPRKAVESVKLAETVPATPAAKPALEQMGFDF